MHTKTIILFVALTLTASCSKDRAAEMSPYPGIEKVNDSFVVYSPEDYSRIFLNDRKAKIKCIDTICPYMENKAVHEVLNGKKIFFVNTLIPQTEELVPLLKKYGIECREARFSDIRTTKYFEPYCYEDTMSLNVCNTFGKHLIDSLTTVSLTNYIKKHPGKPWIEDGVDRRQDYIDGKRVCDIYTLICR